MRKRTAGGHEAWGAVRSAVTSRQLLDTAAAHGIDLADCLTDTGLRLGHLASATAEVSARQEIAIARNLTRLAGDAPGLGIEAGLRYNLANTGILGYALLSSNTVGDALDVICRYAGLTPFFVELRLTRTDTHATLVFDGHRIQTDVRAFFLERDLAVVAHLAPLLIDSRNPLDLTAHLELPGIVLPRELLAYPGAVITVDDQSTRAALTMPRDVLARPMPAADPDAMQMCVQQCQQLLDQRIHRLGLSAQIRTRLLRDPARMPDMRTVAAESAVTVRTLHRRLAAEGTSFRELLDEVRQTVAGELLNSGLTVEETSNRLGYSDPVSFTHAYGRWFGHPPSRRPDHREAD